MSSPLDPTRQSAWLDELERVLSSPCFASLRHPTIQPNARRTD
jgi:hypothetical protein